MRAPTPLAYQDALQNPRLCLSDSELRGGSVEITALGLPRARSGNFGSVFRVSCGGGREFAVKCFTRLEPGHATRYEAITRHLHTVDGDWKVGFSYQARGILADGAWWPILKMEWVSGTGLLPYVKSQVEQPNGPSAIRELSMRFAELVEDLRRVGIAHGDLQHGNILVTSDRRLRLVDYDGMCVPALVGQLSPEVGHPNYQHPRRDTASPGPDLDNFSAWIIYGSLLALAIRPSLWTILDAGDDCLLFKQRDFQDADHSAAFDVLSSGGNDELARLAQALRRIVMCEPRTVPRLDTTALPDLSAIDLGSGVVRQGTGHAVLPSWMQGLAGVAVPGRLATPVLSVPARLASGAPLIWARVVLVGGGVVAALVLLFGVPLPPEGYGRAVGASVSVALVLAAQLVLYVLTPGYRARRATSMALRHTLRAIRGEQRIVEQLTRERDGLDGRLRRLVEQHQRATVRLATDESREVAEAIDALRRRVEQLEMELRQLDSEEAEACARQLETLRSAYVQPRLAGVPLGPGSVPGVCSALLDDLHSMGIRTAGDFIGVTHDGWVRLASGRAVKVRGIGPARGRALQQWRDRLVSAMVSAGGPLTLSMSEKAAIAQRFGGRRATATQQHSSAVRERDQREQAVKARFASKRASEESEFRTDSSKLSSTRQGCDVGVRNAQAKLQALSMEQQRQAATLALHTSVTFSRYIRQVVRFG